MNSFGLHHGQPVKTHGTEEPIIFYTGMALVLNTNLTNVHKLQNKPIVPSGNNTFKKI